MKEFLSMVHRIALLYGLTTFITCVGFPFLCSAVHKNDVMALPKQQKLSIADKVLTHLALNMRSGMRSLGMLSMVPALKKRCLKIEKMFEDNIALIDLKKLYDTFWDDIAMILTDTNDAHQQKFDSVRDIISEYTVEFEIEARMRPDKALIVEEINQLNTLFVNQMLDSSLYPPVRGLGNLINLYGHRIIRYAEQNPGMALVRFFVGLSSAVVLGFLVGKSADLLFHQYVFASQDHARKKYSYLLSKDEWYINVLKLDDIDWTEYVPEYQKCLLQIKNIDRIRKKENESYKNLWASCAAYKSVYDTLSEIATSDDKKVRLASALQGYVKKHHAALKASTILNETDKKKIDNFVAMTHFDFAPVFAAMHGQKKPSHDTKTLRTMVSMLQGWHEKNMQ